MIRRLIKPTRAFAGPCLHEGGRAQVVVRPGPQGGGIRFLREDLLRAPGISANLDNVRQGPRRTSLTQGGIMVSTVEHLLSALWALGIYDAEISLWGAEVPILDGSALPFASDLLAHSEPLSEAEGALSWRVTRSLTRRRGRGVCTLTPGQGLALECRVRYTGIGEQWVRMVGLQRYLERYAPARTFGFWNEAAALRGEGLARGATLGNVLVFDGRAVMNPGGLRFSDEPVRHKVVDALGDLALLGGPLEGNLKLKCCSHALLVSTLRDAIASGALRQGEQGCTNA